MDEKLPFVNCELWIWRKGSMFHIEMVPQLIIMKFELEGIVISEIHIIGQSLTTNLVVAWGYNQ